MSEVKEISICRFTLHLGQRGEKEKQEKDNTVIVIAIRPNKTEVTKSCYEYNNTRNEISELNHEICTR